MSRFAMRKRLLSGLFSAGETGSALVETALTFPVLIMMLLGAVELGEVAYASIETSNAARAGAQYAAVGGGYNDTAGVTAAAQADAYDTYTPQPTSFTVTMPTPACACSDGLGTCSVSGAVGSSPGVFACTSGTPIVTVTVQTTAQFTSPIALKTPFASLGPTFTLHGSAQQVVLQ